MSESASFDFGFFSLAVRVVGPAAAVARLRPFFAAAARGAGEPGLVFAISETPGGYGVSVRGLELGGDLRTGGLIAAILKALPALIEAEPPLWHAGAVGWGEKAVLVVGDEGMVEAAMAWLIDRGFSYLSRSVVQPLDDGRFAGAFPGPFTAGTASGPVLGSLAAFREQPSVTSAATLIVAPDPAWSADIAPRPVAAVLDVDRSDTGVRIGMGSRPKLPQLFGPAAALDGVPMLRAVFAAPGDLQGALDTLLRLIVDEPLDRDATERLVGAIAPAGGPGGGAPARMIYPVPARTERTLTPRLTIGMAVYDDFDGAYFSLQAIRMYHPEVLPQVELLVIDNHPDGSGSAALKSFEAKAANYRYIPNRTIVGTAVRDAIFAEAQGEFVLSMDCHVLFPPGALAALLRFFEANPETRDLVQGPILWEKLDSVSSHWEPRWQAGMFGAWARDPRADDPAGAPFEIPLQGLGVFACRRAAWPGFNPKFNGFGGEEGYIHEKVRQRGGRTLCLPALRWMHRFERPAGVPYPLNWRDRFRNYIIGWQELGLPLDEVVAHMRSHIGDRFADDLMGDMRAAGELQ